MIAVKRAANVAAAAVLAAIVAQQPALGAQPYLPSPLTAAQILQKAEDARGKMQPGSYVEVDLEHSGGLDTTRTTQTDGDDYTEYDKTGPFLSASGSYRGQSWWQDENGIVARVARFRSKVDPNVLAWRHPDDPAYRVRALGLTVSQPQEYVLEANPPGGSDQYRYYDAKTFLLDRVVTWSKDRHRHVTAYTDYRRVFGEMRAFLTTGGDGRPQNAWSERVVSITPAPAGAAPLAIPQTRPLFDVGAAPVKLPVRFTRTGFIIRAMIGGRGLDFLLDSGASNIVLDPGVAHQLGIQAQGRTTATIGGDYDVSRALVPEIGVGALQARNVAVTLGTIDEQVAGARVVGLLGFDFLASGVPCFDIASKTVTLYPRSAFLSQTAGYTPEPMMIDDAVPRIPAAFENTSGWFLLDTGAYATMLYPEYLRKLPSVHLASEREGAIAAVGGIVDTRSYAVNDFALGPLLFRNAVVRVPQQSTFDFSDYDGIIGRDALSEYDACLDYADRQAFLKAASP